MPASIPALTTTKAMKNPGRLFIISLLLLGTAIYAWKNYFQLIKDQTSYAPTEGPRFSEEAGLHFLRQAWWAEIHRTSDETDWRQLEYETQWARYLHQAEILSFRSEGCQLTLFDGRLKGRWAERGSTNQAGSVYQTEYDPFHDEIWLLSAGGSLWKGSRKGTDWTVINQRLQFDPGLLRFVQVAPGRPRLLAILGRIPHYSDDRGVNWTPAEGISFEHGSGRIKDATVFNDSIIYVLSQPAAGEAARLHKSTDGGERFRTVSLFPVEDLDRIGLFLPFHSNHPYVGLKNEANELVIFQVNPTDNTLDELPIETPLKTGVIPVNLTGWQTDTLSRWYTYIEKNNELRLFVTNNQGRKWEDRGLLPAIPWEVGITASPSDPDLLFLGEVECFRSRNGGKDWKRINPWYAYYNDINNNLHADMMHFGEYQTLDSTTFMLISHHGGLSYSEDFFVTQRNLGMEGLNITQYYDTRTSPLDADQVFAGSQDQGLQFNLGFTDGGRAPLAQFLPGDYDHLVYTRGGQSLWVVSPGGWIGYLHEAGTTEVTASWTLPNFRGAVWFPPLAAIPSPDKSQVIMAGGKLNSGEGAHLIRLEFGGDRIRPTQLPFDFRTASEGGNLSAIAVSGASGRWYAATTNGRFFSSADQGQNWQAAQTTGDRAALFYSLAILPSSANPSIVYWGGTGYDQPPVYRSTDGGLNFSPMSAGLPPTVVFDLAANEDESLLFAATQAGPYLYNRTEDRWVDLAAPCSPVQHYLSVEFIESLQTVRFSTFGRGIWDLALDRPVSVRTPELEVDLRLFPNPTSGRLQLTLGKSHPQPVLWELWTVAGQRLQQGLIPAQTRTHEIDLSAVTPGVYFLRLQENGRALSRRVVKY